MNAQPRKGTLSIKVNKDVVKHLSIGLYRNFALAIKEIISNSYDAGATEVKIKLDLKNKKIVIRDNGRGINYDEFKDEYLTIGYFKAPSNSSDELGRMRIGTFGIGFLAPLPYCKVMRIITKRKGADSTIEATINAENFFRKGTWDVREEKVPYEVYKSDLPIEEGETIISLEEIEPHIVEELKRGKSIGKSKLDQFGGFEKFKWTLSQYAPIEFPSEMKELREFYGDPKRISMRVWLDGEELFRNVPAGVRILEKEEKHFGNISLKYVIMTPFQPIKPEEARGLQVRLRDVAVGFPRDFDVTKLGKTLGKLIMLCGEVYIVKGLDNVLMVNRDNFNYTQEVAEMYAFFQGKLRYWNDRLYDLLEEDRKIYDALGSLINDGELIKKLREAKVIRFSKERMRLPEAPITKTKATKVETRPKRIIEALTGRREKDFRVIPKKGKVLSTESPIRVLKKEKIIVVYEDHPSFLERIEYEGKEYRVSFDKWDYMKTPYSICKMEGNRVVYNTSHPLFESKLSDEIVKKFSLGLVLILKNRKDGEELIEKLNRLFERVFIGREE